MNYPTYDHSSMPAPGRHAPSSANSAGRRTDATLARQIAAVASLGVGAIHIATTPSHWAEWFAAGVFFATTAAFQLLWGLLALPIHNVVLRVVGLLANLGIVAVWALSRLSGIPFGPSAGVPEPVGAADLIAVALEAVVIVGLLWTFLPRERHGIVAPAGYRAAVVVAVVAMATAAVPGARLAWTGHHEHGSETTDHHDEHGHDDGDDPSADATEDATDDTTDGPQESETPDEDEHSHDHD